MTVTSKALYVLRHGEPEDRTLFYGQLDVALSERGQGHVLAQAEFFASRRVGSVVSSDLTRCTIGAAAIAARHELPVRSDAALREMHLGVLEGVPMSDALQRMPDLAGRSYGDMLDFAFPQGGESVREVAKRALPAVEAMVRDGFSREGDLVLYVHNTVARVVLAAAAGLGPEGYVRFEQRYGAVNRLRVESGDESPWARSAIVYCNRAV